MPAVVSLAPPRPSPHVPPRRSRVVGALRFAEGDYAAALRHPELGAEARRYLAARGYDDLDWLIAHGVGFATGKGLVAGWRRRTGGGEEAAADLVEAGVCSKRDDSEAVREFLRGRITFAIRGPANPPGRGGTGGEWRPIAFGGRALGDAEPKYLNTPDTPLFHKGQVLYGFEWALSAIRQTQTVFVVEGYFDVLRPQWLGIRNVVAPLGTALTEAHVDLVHACVASDRPVHWVFCLDADAAGASAVLRGAQTVLPKLRPGATATVMTLTGGKDPDKVLLDAGARAGTVWDQAVQRRRPVMETVLAGQVGAMEWTTSLDALVSGLRRVHDFAGSAPPELQRDLVTQVQYALTNHGFSPSPRRLPLALLGAP